MSTNNSEKLEITTAKKLRPDVVSEIRSLFGNVEIEQIIDSSLISGIKIKQGSKLYELNLSSEISEFRRRLLIAAKNAGSNDLLAPFKQEIENLSVSSKIHEVGEVISIKDGIVEIGGLRGAKSLEVLNFETGQQGMALNLEEKSIGAIVLGDFSSIKQGDRVERSGAVMSVPVGNSLLGRVVNSLGEAVDGLGEINTNHRSPVEKVAPGVMARTPVNTPLQTGIKSIDSLIPIGRGQRELILGDRQTGKTAIAIDTIINQKDKDVICIYVAIGQKESKVARLVSKLKEAGAMEHTIVVLAGASESSPMLYLAPYAGVAMAEHFAENGKDVLIVYDDLSKQAVAYREMSLLLRRPPGREAYPGDVFYLHSRLLERAVNLDESHGGGSITALPIIETQGGDNGAYIPTNVISITDGQIYVESDLFYKGIRPAINVGASVSRVGSAAQTKPMKKAAGSMKLQLAQFRDLEAFAQFSSDLDPETKRQIIQGQKITELLKQDQYQPLTVEEQVVTIYAVSRGYFDDIPTEKLRQAETELHKHCHNFHSELMEKLATGDWTDETELTLKSAIFEFVDRFNSDKTNQ